MKDPSFPIASPKTMPRYTTTIVSREFFLIILLHAFSTKAICGLSSFFSFFWWGVVSFQLALYIVFLCHCSQ